MKPVPRRLALKALASAAALAAALLTAASAQAGEVGCFKGPNNSRILGFAGGIDGGDGKAFLAKFKACYLAGDYKGPMVVDLNSPGGSVDDALAISNELVKYQASSGNRITMRVSPGSYCISACTYIFVAGDFREVIAGGSFEPHGFSSFSGNRIDQTLDTVAKSKDHSVAAAAGIVKFGRLKWMILSLIKQFDADARLAWIIPLATAMIQALSTPNASMDPMLNAWYGLTPDQRALISHLDSVVNLVLTEAEREAALKAFQVHLDADSRPANVDLTSGLGKGLAKFTNQMNAEYLQGFNAWIASAKAGARMTTLGASRADIEEMLNKQTISTMNTVNEDLWPYLKTRKDDVDIDGLVKLMFSTSILYTRPLTREEICDFNIANKDCAQ